jgi:hypothetical protein
MHRDSLSRAITCQRCPFFVGETSLFPQEAVNLFVGFVLLILASAYFKEAGSETLFFLFST